MRAREAYRVIARRGGWMPSLLAHHDRLDHVEVVDIADGEVVLFWDCTPPHRKRLARVLREELVQLDADEFIDRWRAAAD
ncbi:MAG: hypothetical protein ACYCUM_01605 [Solirubrobacteraceae bacterium]